METRNRTTRGKLMTAISLILAIVMLVTACGQAVGGAVKADIESGLAVVHKIADLFLVGYLRDQTARNQFFIRSHVVSP